VVIVEAMTQLPILVSTVLLIRNLGIAGGRLLRDMFVTNNGCTKKSPREPAKGSKIHVETQYTGYKSGYPVT